MTKIIAIITLIAKMPVSFTLLVSVYYSLSFIPIAFLRKYRSELSRRRFHDPGSKRLSRKERETIALQRG
ncbi:MAG TPA: hypothetical protein VHO90_04815, partial [Bacteroidales bacterium]|nr:hypothetical protein [Bacteroidales bacterium]